MSNSITPQHPEATVVQLAEAFRVFTDASSRLEKSYTELQHEAEELRGQLRRKDEEIKKNERLATLGEMAAAMAHEIRNPLGAMKLFLSLIRRECEGRNSAETLIEQMDISIESLDAIVSNMLHFAKGKALVLSPVNLISVVEAIQLQFRSLYPRIVWKVERSPESCSMFVRGNEHALRQVLHNLLLNAAQAMRGQGTCTTRIVSEISGVALSIEDSGPGIDPALKEKLFEPFVTNRNEGTGLGLAVVRQIVEQHGGWVKVGEGSTGGARFEITWPASR